MLGFMAALVNEASTGLGPIGQVAWWMGSTQPGEGWYHNAGVALLSFAALMAAAAYASGHAGTMQGGAPWLDVVGQGGGRGGAFVFREMSSWSSAVVRQTTHHTQTQHHINNIINANNRGRHLLKSRQRRGQQRRC